MNTQYLKNNYVKFDPKDDSMIVQNTSWENCALLQFIATDSKTIKSGSVLKFADDIVCPDEDNGKVFVVMANEHFEILWMPVQSQFENQKIGPNLRFTNDVITPVEGILKQPTPTRKRP